MAKTMTGAVVNWSLFGQWVSERQGVLKISDRELARRSGLSPTHIGDVKKGLSGVSDKTFTSIVHALESTESEARIAMQIEKPELTEEEREVLQAMRRVPDPEKPLFVSIVKATGQAFSSCK